MYAESANTISSPVPKMPIRLTEKEAAQVKEYSALLKDKSDKTPMHKWRVYLARKGLFPKSMKKKSVERMMTNQLNALPTKDELEAFTLLLETSSNTKVSDHRGMMMSFKGMEELLEKSPPCLRSFIRPATLFGRSAVDLELDEDKEECLSIDVINHYIQTKQFLFRHRISMACYDYDCTGYLDLRQLKRYLRYDLIQNITPLKALQPNSQETYLEVVMQMCKFFLDCHGRGKIRIADILTSGFIDNIVSLEYNSDDASGSGSLQSWFAPEKTQELVTSFHAYDVGSKGYLTQKDFIQVEDASFSYAFVERLFATHVKKDRGMNMDFMEFVIFNIARDHMTHPTALKYFFDILDINNRGCIGLAEMTYFYKDLRMDYNNYLHDDNAMPLFDDMVNELFDMIRPENPWCITLKDLVRSRQGNDFVFFLTNFIELYRHESSDGGDLGADDDSIMPQDDEGGEGVLDEGMLDGAEGDTNEEEEEEEDMEREIPMSSVSI